MKVDDIRAIATSFPNFIPLMKQMGALIDDDVLHTIAACGTPAEVAAHIRDRVDGIADRICIYQPGPIAAESLAQIVDALRT